MYRASVVILNWNGIGFLRQYLPLLVEHTTYNDVELVVADNNSSDGSQEYIKNAFPTVRLIEFAQNHGFAGGYNLALNQIEAKYFILLNSDVEVTKGWIEPLLDFLDKNDDVAAVMPKIHSVHDKSLFEYAGAAGGYIDMFGYPFCRGRVFDHLEKDNGQYDDVAEVFWATGACLTIRSEVYKALGGLDEHFFAHMEEIDLCWRVQWDGYRIFCVPQSVIYHYGGGALPKESPKKIFLNFRNSLYMLVKNLTLAYLPLIIFCRLFFDAVAGLQFLLKKKPDFAWAVVKAWFSFIVKIPFYLNYRRKSHKTRVSKKWDKLVFHKSVVCSYFVLKKQTFTEIIK
jgi:GT2 family glycosyltransferase